MNSQQTSPQASDNLVSEKSPGLPAARVGSADMTAGGSGTQTEQNPGYHPALPGMEKYCPQGRPYEFNRCTKPLTNESHALLDKWEQERSVNVGACINIYPNGEITGGFYKTGRKPPPRREGRTISQEFTPKARKTIRRAVACGLVTFKGFLTLTFDPKLSQLDESGKVEQSWAKLEFKRFMNSIKKILDRKSETKGDKPFSYIWVAEVQKNGNIHFHILVDRFIPVKWLVKVWNQSSNSLNIIPLKDQIHAVNYMLKYMKKGNCPIEGKRYGMTQDLLNAIKPVKVRYEGLEKREAFKKVKRESYWDINQNGGMVSDFGFFIPPHRRERVYRDKQGQTQRTKGVSRQLSIKFLSKLHRAMKLIDYEHSCDEVQADTQLVDLPF